MVVLRGYKREHGQQMSDKNEWKLKLLNPRADSENWLNERCKTSFDTKQGEQHLTHERFKLRMYLDRSTTQS